MLDSHNLDELLARLETMTDTQRQTPPDNRSKRFRLALLISTIALAVLFSVAIGLHHFLPKWHPEVALGLAFVPFLLYILGIGAYITADGIRTLRVVQRAQKERSSVIWDTLSTDMHTDAAHVVALCQYPKSDLEFALMQYHHHWKAFDRRVALIVGKVHKFGLFPGLLSLAFSLAKLIGSHDNGLFWYLLMVLGFLYLMGFAASDMTERPFQVAKLLQYAIDHVDEIRQQSRPPAAFAPAPGTSIRTTHSTALPGIPGQSSTPA